MKNCIVTLLLALAPAGLAYSAENPNILLILVDDLKPALGCYGDPHAKTPHIDALAARGMRFDLAYCNQAVCAPSRFTLMLGSHSTSTGLYGLGSHLRKTLPDAVTMPQHFAKHGGYRTESLGKIFHIGHGNHGDPAVLLRAAHFKERVIEYVDPASKPDGKLTREEAMFQNKPAPPGGMNKLPRGAAFESPDVPDWMPMPTGASPQRPSAACGRQRSDARRTARRSSSPPASPVRTCRSPRQPNTGISTNVAGYRSPPIRTCRQNSPEIAHKRGGEIRNYFPVPDKGRSHADQ